MHISSLLATLAASSVASGAVIAKAAAPTDLPCPKGFTQFKLNFNDLGTNPPNKTHGVRDTAAAGANRNIYGKLSWNPADWQVVNPGYRDVTNGFHRENAFVMTTHQGQGALVTTQEYAYLRTNYNDEVFSLQSFWLRHEYAGAFNLEIVCDVYQAGGGYKTPKAVVSIPARPYGQYVKVQLTAAQQKSFAKASSCDMAVTPHQWCDGPQPCFGDNALLIDDLNYCWANGQ